MMVLFFLLGSLMAVAGASGVVLARKPVHGVIAMLLNFLGLAVLYLTLQAEFLAVVQIIVYAGAVMVLFLFVVALLTAQAKTPEVKPSRLRGQGWLAGGVAFLLLVALVPLGMAVAGEAGPWEDDFGGVVRFGQELLTTHLLAFEALALVLMVAVIGVVILVGQPPQRRGRGAWGGGRS